MDFDVTRAIPVNSKGIRQPAFDVSRAIPVTDGDREEPKKHRGITAKQVGDILVKNLKAAPKEALKDISKMVQVIRWPFWRFIEHPVSTVIEAAQKPGEEPVSQTIKKAAQTFVPFRKIPKEEYGTYGKVWDNYYQATMQLKGYKKDEKKTPLWYIAMSSYGSAMAVEPLAIRAYAKGAEAAITRVATAEEAAAVRAHFKPLQAALKNRGIKPKDLNKEGNIIKVDEGSEIFMNKYVSAVLRGDKVRVPRWANVKMPDAVPATVAKGTGLVPKAAEIFPTTGPEVVLKTVPGVAKTAQVLDEALKPIEIPPEGTLMKKDVGPALLEFKGVTGDNFVMTESKPPRRVPKGEKGQILRTTPPEKPKFGVEKEFLEQPKKKTTILQYFTPAEYHLKQLGFDAKIGQPVREALQDFSIELMRKSELVINTQKMHQVGLEKRNIKLKKSDKVEYKASLEKIWQYMDKGIPAKSKSIEAKVSRKYRKETEEMLTRINEVNKRIGRDEVKGVKDYILHMLKPEILNEVYSSGVIPPELAKVMEYIPPKKLFLRTAQQRKGVPEEWLEKDPHMLMQAMYAIDLKYIHLQDALSKIDPYLKAVKEYYGEGKDYWSPETYKYLDDWVKQAIKMRPSNWDTLTDNLLEYTLAPLFRKAGVKVSHMPWRDFVNTLSSAAHTGALGMRVRPILRNLVQSTFDWVFYGTKPYLKGSKAFKTKAGQEILKQSKIWQTRLPFEAQDLSTLNKIFKTGSVGYRWSDLHNVGKGLLTRYYHATDTLGMTHKEALAWADKDLPASQWSYRREDLPRAYWTTTGRAFWTLGSWWMNFYTRFVPELSRRAFTGFDVSGRAVTPQERLGIIRFFMLVGLLFGVKKASKELTGTAVDYTGQVSPSFLRLGPVSGLGENFINIGQGIADKNEQKLKDGMKGLADDAKIFIPWYLAGKDLFDLLNGKKELQDVLFYTDRDRKKKTKIRD